MNGITCTGDMEDTHQDRVAYKIDWAKYGRKLASPHKWQGDILFSKGPVLLSLTLLPNFRWLQWEWEPALSANKCRVLIASAVHILSMTTFVWLLGIKTCCCVYLKKRSKWGHGLSQNHSAAPSTRRWKGQEAIDYSLWDKAGKMTWIWWLWSTQTGWVKEASLVLRFACRSPDNCCRFYFSLWSQHRWGVSCGGLKPPEVEGKDQQLLWKATKQ